MDNFLTVFANGFTSLYFYVLNYSIYILIAILFIVAGVLEYKEKQHLYVNDERKVT